MATWVVPIEARTHSLLFPPVRVWRKKSYALCTCMCVCVYLHLSELSVNRIVRWHSGCCSREVNSVTLHQHIFPVLSAMSPACLLLSQLIPPKLNALVSVMGDGQVGRCQLRMFGLFIAYQRQRSCLRSIIIYFIFAVYSRLCVLCIYDEFHWYVWDPNLGCYVPISLSLSPNLFSLFAWHRSKSNFVLSILPRYFIMHLTCSNFMQWK